MPLLLLNVAVFSVPSAWSCDARLAYAYISYALLGTAYAFVNIPYGSLANVMTQEPRQRSRLSATRTLPAAPLAPSGVGRFGRTLTFQTGMVLATTAHLSLLLVAPSKL